VAKCDICGKEAKNGTTVLTSNLAGVIMCRKCYSPSRWYKCPKCDAGYEDQECICVTKG
jgi:ribosome-binding protein aMBF1 (putative translation factor)